MAKCPKCGRKLTLLDWKPNCPDCGINLVYYGMEERLMDEADAAEAEHAKTQKFIDKMKASFISSKLTIVRIILSVLPIAALMLPLSTITYSGPFIAETTKNINAIEIYNLISSLNFDDLFTMIGHGTFGDAFVGYFGALVCILLSLVCVILSLLMLIFGCFRGGNIRNLLFNSLAIIPAIASIFMYKTFASNIVDDFSAFVTNADISFGIFVYIATLFLLLGINIFFTIKPIQVKYKPCFVGGIPAEEYFELVKAGTDKNTLHKIMEIKLSEQRAQKEAEEEAKEAKAAKEKEEAKK